MLGSLDCCLCERASGFVESMIIASFPCSFGCLLNSICIFVSNELKCLSIANLMHEVNLRWQVQNRLSTLLLSFSYQGHPTTVFCQML